MTKAFFEYSFLGFFLVLFPVDLTAQFVTVKPGQTLSYTLKENNEKCSLNFKITSVAPFLTVDWSKNNAFKDAGSFKIDTFALQNAVNLWFGLNPANELIELTDALPGLCLSKKMFLDLTNKGKTWIRLDCNLKSEELVLKTKKKVTINYIHNTIEVEVLQLSFGVFNDELWVINNFEFPLLIKWKGMNSWDLIEISN